MYFKDVGWSTNKTSGLPLPLNFNYDILFAKKLLPSETNSDILALIFLFLSFRNSSIKMFLNIYKELFLTRRTI